MDDEVELLVTLKQFFERRDYLVWVANSGEAAVQLISRHQPHAVLLDQDLGRSEFQGLEVLQQLAQQWPKIAVFILEKPFSVAALLRMLEHTIDEGR